MGINSSNQIKLGALISYVGIALNILAGLLFTPWLVDALGKVDYGLYTTVNSIIALFVMDFGLSAAATKYISQYHAEGNEDKVNRFLGTIYTIYLIIAVIIFAILTTVYFFIGDIYTEFTPGEIERLKVVYVIAGAASVLTFPFVTLNGVLNAYEKFIQLKLADVIFRGLVVGLMVTALLTGMGLYGVVLASALSSIITIIYKLIIVKRNTPAKIAPGEVHHDIASDIVKYSFWVIIASIASRLIFNITPTIMGRFYASEVIGVFGIVVSLESYSYNVTSAINGMFMPRISSIYVKSEDANKDLLNLMIKVGKFQFALNGLIIVGFAVVGGEFVKLWLKSAEYTVAEYNAVYWGTLLVIIPGIFFNSFQVANTSMLVKNKVNIQAWAQLIVGICNIILLFIFVPRLGVIGACISIGIAYTIRNVVFAVLHKTKMHIDMKQFMLKCYTRLLIPIAGTLALGLILNLFFTEVSWTVVAIKAIIIAAAYGGLALVCGFSKTERKELMTLVRRK